MLENIFERKLINAKWMNNTFVLFKHRLKILFDDYEVKMKFEY